MALLALTQPAWCSTLYTAKQVVQLLSSTAGPLLSVAMFMYLGNAWKVCMPTASAAAVQAGLVAFQAKELHLQTNANRSSPFSP